MSDTEDVCVTFVRAWSESVLRQTERVRAVEQEASRQNRQLDREWNRDQELALEAVWRQNWTDAHALIWAVHQLDRWVRRLATERGAGPGQEDETLRDLRNALEHLDEAILDGGHVAEPGGDQKANRSLRRLPGGRIHIATGGKLFGVVSLTELERIAREQHNLMEQKSAERDEEMVEATVDSYIDDLIASRRDEGY